MRNYRIRRGLRFRDSDASEHGRRYDALVSLGDGSSVTVASKDAALVWLSFDCRGVKPGVYRGVLEITPLSGGRKTKIESDGTRGFVVHDDSKSVPVELTVRTFALPDSPFGFNGYARIVEQQTLDWLDSVGVRPTHVMLTPWHFECDFNSDGAIVKRRLREYAVPEVRFYAKNIAKVPGLPRVMVGYSAYEHYREQISRKAPFRRGSDEYWRGYREWMKYIDDVVTSNGIARDDYTVEVFDEPSRARVPDDNEVRRALQETHMAVKGISVMITSGAPYYELIKDDVDDWVYYAGYTTLYSKAKAWATASRRVSVYQCDVGIRQENHRNYRVLPWRALAVGGNYVSLFQLVSQCPGTDFRTATFGEIVLRGEKATISTIRAENFVLGLTDVRYVKLLETLAERKPEKREFVRRFLDQTVHDIVFTYPHDPEKAEIFREEASRMIVELK